MGQPRTVIIVDDHPLLRAGLKSLLQSVESYSIVGEVGTGESALTLAAELQPDLMTLDLSLPDQNGLGVIRRILTASPATAILVVSTHTKFEYVSAAFRAGARGYLVKEAAADLLLKALDTLLLGDTYLDAAIAVEVAGRLGGVAQNGKDHLARYEKLTRREQEVLRLVAEGLSSKAIAERLFISHKTVENHRANIKAKIGLRNTVEILRFAVRYGLVESTD